MSQVSKDFPKFAVPFPEAGEGAYLHMSVPELEALEALFGDEYFKIIEIGFRHPSPAVISRALALCLKDGDASAAPWGLSLVELGRRLYDAQLRMWKGITLAEAEAAIEAAAAAEAVKH